MFDSLVDLSSAIDFEALVKGIKGLVEAPPSPTPTPRAWPPYSRACPPRMTQRLLQKLSNEPSVLLHEDQLHPLTFFLRTEPTTRNRARRCGGLAVFNRCFTFAVPTLGR